VARTPWTRKTTASCTAGASTTSTATTGKCCGWTRTRCSEGERDDAHGTIDRRADAGGGHDAARAGARAGGEALVAAASEVAVAGAARAARGHDPRQDRGP